LETDAAYEARSLDYLKMDKVQKNNNPESYTPSPEPSQFGVISECLKFARFYSKGV
jgi:hypothetical protein